MSTENFILKTDSYKLTHHDQYPKGTCRVYSYLESRGGKYPSTLFFGLQYFLKQLAEVKITKEDVLEAEDFCLEHFGKSPSESLFNKEGWIKIVENGGHLPIKIMAVKEGTLVQNSNVLMTIENTDPDAYWLTNALETMLMRIWYPITVATNSFYAKKTIKHYMQKTGGNLDMLPFKLHDFGYRGVSSEETAGLGGMAHLVSFAGTDTLAGITFAKKYYEGGMTGFSVPASEHSVACSYGKDNEYEYFNMMLDTYPTGIVSIVSDTYDVYNFVSTMSKARKDAILARDGVVVFRPDSGDPIEVNSKLIDILWSRFGGEYTEEGYKLLDPHVRLIQGDGIDNQMIDDFLKHMTAKGFCADNWVFGSGGGLLQKFDRDTQKFAIKASLTSRFSRGSHGMVADFGINKQPATQEGKASKKGRLKLHPSGMGGYHTVSNYDVTKELFNSYVDALEPVFEDGKILREQTFEEIREIANSHLL